MSARKNVQTGFQPVSLDTNFFIYVIYNKHLNNFPINFTIKELIFSSIQDKYKINIFNNRTAILRNEKGRSIRILYYTKREKKKKRKKRNKRHKYSEFQHADRSFDLVANKFLPPFSDSPSLCKGKPRPFSPSFLPLVFQQLSALHSFKREFFASPCQPRYLVPH